MEWHYSQTLFILIALPFLFPAPVGHFYLLSTYIVEARCNEKSDKHLTLGDKE